MSNSKSGGFLDRTFKLKENKVLVRHFGLERIKDYNRITVGSRAQMDSLAAALEKILK